METNNQSNNTNNNEPEKTFWQKHKKGIIIGGIAIAGVGLCFLGISHAADIKDFITSMKDASDNLKEIPIPATPAIDVTDATTVITDTTQATSIEIQEQAKTISTAIDVSEHIRNLPDGWHASAEKLAEADEKGIELNDGQTWVDGYTKGAAT